MNKQICSFLIAATIVMGPTITKAQPLILQPEGPVSISANINSATIGNALGIVSLPSPDSSSPTAGIKEALNSLTYSTTTNSVGGGEVDFGPGVFNFNQVIWLSNDFPVSIKLKGAGEGRTYLVYTGPTNTTAIRCSKQSGGLAPTLHFESDGITYSYMTNSTNCIFNFTSSSFVKIYNCGFMPWYMVTNGYMPYGWSWDPNILGAFTQKPGLVGIGFACNAGLPDGINDSAFYNIRDNNFVGLACGIFDKGLRGNIVGNMFYGISYYKDAGNSSHYNTNIYTGDTQGNTLGTVDETDRGLLTSGAAIISFTPGQKNIALNNFLICGPTFFGTLAGLYGNTYESCNSRCMIDDSSIATGSLPLIWAFEGGLDVATDSQNSLPPDKIITYTANFVIQGPTSPTNPIPWGVTSVGGNGSTRTNALFIAGAMPNGIYSSKSVATVSTAISFPNTTVKWTNQNTFNIVLYINNSGVTVTSISKNNQQIFGSLANDTTLFLKPGDYFAEAYTGSPSARWEPQ